MPTPLVVARTLLLLFFSNHNAHNLSKIIQPAKILTNMTVLYFVFDREHTQPSHKKKQQWKNYHISVQYSYTLTILVLDISA